jgi:hypothetical protein
VCLRATLDLPQQDAGGRRASNSNSSIDGSADGFSSHEDADESELLALLAAAQEQAGPATSADLAPAAPGSGKPGTVPVRFEVPEYTTHWGQVLKVVGSLEELGSWKVEKVGAVGWWAGWCCCRSEAAGPFGLRVLVRTRPLPGRVPPTRTTLPPTLRAMRVCARATPRRRPPCTGARGTPGCWTCSCPWAL